MYALFCSFLTQTGVNQERAGTKVSECVLNSVTAGFRTSYFGTHVRRVSDLSVHRKRPQPHYRCRRVPNERLQNKKPCCLYLKIVKVTTIRLVTSIKNSSGGSWRNLLIKTSCRSLGEIRPLLHSSFMCNEKRRTEERSSQEQAKGAMPTANFFAGIRCTSKWSHIVNNKSKISSAAGCVIFERIKLISKDFLSTKPASSENAFKLSLIMMI